MLVHRTTRRFSVVDSLCWKGACQHSSDLAIELSRDRMARPDCSMRTTMRGDRPPMKDTAAAVPRTASDLSTRNPAFCGRAISPTRAQRRCRLRSSVTNDSAMSVHATDQPKLKLALSCRPHRKSEQAETDFPAPAYRRPRPASLLRQRFRLPHAAESGTL